MDKLDTDDKKNKLLSFMITNRNVILSLPKLFDKISKLNNWFMETNYMNVNS